MKYKVTCNGTIMGDNMSALRSLNIVCGILKGSYVNGVQTPLTVKIHYLSWVNGEPTWKLENSFKVGI